MAKLDTSGLIFLPESESLIDSNAGLNRVIKQLLRKVEKKLLAIELTGTEITVVLKGQIHLSTYPLKELEYEFSPITLPPRIQSRIENVIGKAVLTLLPKIVSPPN